MCGLTNHLDVPDSSANSGPAIRLGSCCVCGSASQQREGGMTMDPQHPDCGGTRPLVACVLLAVAAALSCTPGAELGDSEPSSHLDVEITGQSPAPVPAVSP